MKSKTLRVGLIGLGSMAKTVADSFDTLNNEQRSNRIVGALVRKPTNRYSTSLNFPLFNNIEDLLREVPDVIIECASHSAVEKYGETILNHGITLILASIGALADDSLYNKLKTAANNGNGSLLLPAGAVGGLDALSAAKISGLKRVCYKGRKPPAAWKGTTADQLGNLMPLLKAKTLYSGNAREAALLYPMNSNVAATVALAGLGLDKTEVELIADPDIQENIHEIEVFANSGDFKITLSSKTLSNNTKTSALAAYSMAKSAMKLNDSIII